jgi:hypothetical protein
MKKLFWLIAFSLTTFFALGQEINLKQKTYWETEKPKFNFEKPIIIDTVDHCKEKVTIKSNDLCYYKKPQITSEWKSNDVEVNVKKYQPYQRSELKNFNLHISTSVGIKLADMSISKFRLDIEKETTNKHLTIGSTLNLYTLQYYYNGWRLMGYTRFYFVENSSGEGAFLQLALGGGNFKNDLNGDRFKSLGASFDVGNKFLIGKEKNNYKDWFTVTVLGGFHTYGAPDGTMPISFIYQIRWGYQF